MSTKQGHWSIKVKQMMQEQLCPQVSCGAKISDGAFLGHSAFLGVYTDFLHGFCTSSPKMRSIPDMQYLSACRSLVKP
jgi:hypothetical protein